MSAPIAALTAEAICSVRPKHPAVSRCCGFLGFSKSTTSPTVLAPAAVRAVLVINGRPLRLWAVPIAKIRRAVGYGGLWIPVPDTLQFAARVLGRRDVGCAYILKTTVPVAWPPT